MNCNNKWRFLQLCLLAFVLFSCENTPQTPVVVNQSLPANNNYTAGYSLQNIVPAVLDQSPLDIIYYPIDFPKLKSKGEISGLPKIRVLYSRPQLHDRPIFGELQKYGQPWRMGANEATEIELFENALINGKTLEKGRYIMYCIPQADYWTIAFNKELYTWGLQFDASEDVLRIEVPVVHLARRHEVLHMFFEEAASGLKLTTNSAKLVLEWEQISASILFKFNN